MEHDKLCVAGLQTAIASNLTQRLIIKYFLEVFVARLQGMMFLAGIFNWLHVLQHINTEMRNAGLGFICTHDYLDNYEEISLKSFWKSEKLAFTFIPWQKLMSGKYFMFNTGL